MRLKFRCAHIGVDVEVTMVDIFKLAEHFINQMKTTMNIYSLGSIIFFYTETSTQKTIVTRN